MTLPAIDTVRIDLLATEADLLERLAKVWSSGWQPTELMRQAEKMCSRLTRLAARFQLDLLRETIAHDYGATDRTALDDRWIEQIATMGVRRATGRTGWIEVLLRSHDHGAELLGPASNNLTLLFRLMVFRPVEPLMRHPSIPNWRGNAASGQVADPILDRVRHLLAKAESTTFEAEAEAFTIKANELMARHSIDKIVAGETSEGRTRPVSARLAIDGPYFDSKCLLVSSVAKAHRCRVVWNRGWEILTLMGFPDDVAAVELLATSMLVQAQSALSAIGQCAPVGSEARTKSFRSAFLVSFGRRIAERLAQSNDLIVEQSDRAAAGSLLPVLQSRAEELDVFYNQWFGEVRPRGPRSYDAAGWASGRVAADNARIGSGELR